MSVFPTAIRAGDLDVREPKRRPPLGDLGTPANRKPEEPQPVLEERSTSQLPWSVEDPEPQPGRRDRLEVPGVGEEDEGVLELDRQDLCSLEDAIGSQLCLVAQGINTLLITWMTPLEAITFALTTVAPPTITFSPLTRIESDLPSRVLAERSFIACAAVTLPLTT
jgi:hypothetical protein